METDDSVKCQHADHVDDNNTSIEKPDSPTIDLEKLELRNERRRRESYEEASEAYYAAKEDKHHDKENVQKLKKEMINAYYQTPAGKEELKRNNGIRYQPKKLCLDDATDTLNLMDKFTFTS